MDNAINRLEALSSLSQGGIRIIQKLQKHGYEAYFVGGCIRDCLLGSTPKDFDIVTNARPREIAALFPQALIIGKRFTLVHIRFGEELFEVATFRKSPPSQDKGEMISHDNHFGSRQEDCQRRDFTVNAIYYDPIRRKIFDPFSGLADLHHRTLKMIGVPSERFSEDPVRMIRAVRYSAKLNIKIDGEITAAIGQSSLLLLKIPKARLYEEYLKCFLHHRSIFVFDALDQHKLLRYFIPKHCLLEKRKVRTLLARLQKIPSQKAHRAALLLAVFIYPYWILKKKNRAIFEQLISDFHHLIAYQRQSDIALREIFHDVRPSKDDSYRYQLLKNMSLLRSEIKELLQER